MLLLFLFQVHCVTLYSNSARPPGDCLRANRIVHLTILESLSSGQYFRTLVTSVASIISTFCGYTSNCDLEDTCITLGSADKISFSGTTTTNQSVSSRKHTTLNAPIIVNELHLSPATTRDLAENVDAWCPAIARGEQHLLLRERRGIWAQLSRFSGITRELAFITSQHLQESKERRRRQNTRHIQKPVTPDIGRRIHATRTR
jgi:hypothetical protein